MAHTVTRASAPEGKSFLYHLRASDDDLLGYLEHIASFGDVVQMGIFPAYLANSPETVQQVLISKHEAFDKPQTLTYVIAQLFDGDNIFSASQARWDVIHRSVQPALHRQQVASYLRIMVDSIEQTSATWQDNGRIDMADAISDLSIRVSSRSLFGQDLLNDEVGEAILTIFEIFSDRVPKQYPIPKWLPLDSNRRMKEAVATLDAFIMPLIKKRRASSDRGDDLLGMLLAAQATDDTGILTDHQIRNELIITFIAGFEVNAVSVAITLYLLIQHPDIMDHLRAEIIQTLDDTPLSMAHLKQMPYLDQVIKESMRIYPVGAIVSRQTNRKVAIGGYTIPKSAQVFVSPWTLHRRESVFPDPETFDPQRFTPENEKAIPKNAYIPFSAGPRICIGNAFAMLFIRTTLALIIPRFDFVLDDNYQFDLYSRFNLRLQNGLPLTIQAR